jgi:lipid A 3-O-deacylase
MALAGLAPIAQAKVIEEVRLGVLDHNICVTDCKNADKEDGPNISGEVVFTSPDFLDLVWSPRPYVIASINTAGDTSYGGVGLHWNWNFAEGWSLEPGLGYVIHDNELLDSPFPQGDPRNLPFDATNAYLGSEDLFRTSLALNRNIGDDWAVQVLFEHLSHGQILGDGRNQGMDNLGVRIARRF